MIVIKMEGYHSDTPKTPSNDKKQFKYDCCITNIRLVDLQTSQPISHFSQVAVADGIEVTLSVVPEDEHCRPIVSSSEKKGKMVEIFRGNVPTYIACCEKRHGDQPYAVLYGDRFNCFFAEGLVPWHHNLSSRSLAGIHIPIDWYLL